jgi:gluconate:H+ symporter, GntP family
MSPEAFRLSAAFVGIILLVVLVAKLKWHPFLALMLVSWALAVTCGIDPVQAIAAFSKGFGDILSFVGIVIGLGTMIGGLLVSSGGADAFANAMIAAGGRKYVPWTIFFAAFLIGLPLFFEVGFVLLVPLAFVIAKKMEVPVLSIGLPMLAGLSIAHGMTPPHPAPTLAVATFHADAGRTILYALVIGLPVGLISGPVFASVAAKFFGLRRTTRKSTEQPGSQMSPAEEIIAVTAETAHRTPTLGGVLLVILLPPALMMGRSVSDLALPPGPVKVGFDLIGNPIVALFITVVVAVFVLGVRLGENLNDIQRTLNRSLEPIAAVVLIVGAGGGFKEVLLETKIADAIGLWAAHAHLSPLVLAWTAAAVVRIATGSATVATITGAGIVAPLIQNNATVNRELLVLATGSGSLILSHVNDAGFWLVKEYFGLTVAETFKYWTTMETLLSILGLAGVLLASLIG